MGKNRHKRGPTIGPQAEIDSLAGVLVRQWLVSGWILRRREPDIFIDYEIEKIESREPSGLIFYAQQKAHEKIRRRGNFAIETLSTAHLVYYAGLSYPVFLFQVDVRSRKGLWLFLQEWVDRNAGARLKSQKTIDVDIPLANRLDDTPQLSSALRRATDYMRDKNPGSVEAAVRKDIERLTRLDPRVSVSLDYVSGVKQYTLHPKTPFTFRLHVPRSQADRVRELHEFGRPIELSGDGLNVEGFPLIEELLKQAGFRFSFTPDDTRDCEFELWCTDSDTDFRIAIPCKGSRGASGLLFMGELKGAPLRLEFRILPPLLEGPGEVRATVAWNFEAWRGIPILDLPYFEALHEFVRLYRQGREIRHRLSFQGQKLTQGTLGKDGTKGLFENVEWALHLLSDARSIARVLNVQLRFPRDEPLSDADAREIDYLRAIMSPAGYRMQRRELVISLVASGPSVCAAVTSAREGNYRISTSNHVRRLWGTELDVGPVVLEIGPARIVLSEASRDRLKKGDDSDIEIDLQGLGDAVFTVRRVAVQHTAHERE